VRIYLDNIIFSLQRAGGISNYWGELCKSLHSRTDAVFVEDERAQSNLFRQRIALSPERVVRNEQIPVWLRRYLPDLSGVPEGSIFHSSYYRSHLPSKVANVVTVYDFIYEHHRRGMPRLVHRFQKWLALRRADGIICISGNTFRDLKELYPNVRRRKIAVIPLAASETYRKIESEEAERYSEVGVGNNILFVGGRNGYKNFRLAVRAVSTLPQFHLCIIGKPLRKEESRYVSLHLGSRWHSVQNPDPDKLNSLYNRAFCLLYPSEYEGFGIPILEAMQAGCPVVTADRSSLAEVVGAAAVISSDKTAEAFARAIRQLENEGCRQKMMSAGLVQARKFSWDRCVEQTLNFYHEVFHAKFGYL
jgi:glycosyltransferase involved in cell wall biosynthesis